MLTRVILVRIFILRSRAIVRRLPARLQHHQPLKQSLRQQRRFRLEPRIIFCDPEIKDTTGNGVSGNGSTGAYVVTFSTAGAFSQFSSFGTGGGDLWYGQRFSTVCQGSQPTPGKVNVPLNTKMFITFSEAMKNTSGNLANISPIFYLRCLYFQ